MLAIDPTTESALENAHKHCSLHAVEIAESELCGCFYCLSRFPPAAISDWIDDRNVVENRTGRTALCPKCRIDSVIESASGFPVTEEFLQLMRKRWFE
jgi:hypothetical protein